MPYKLLAYLTSFPSAVAARIRGSKNETTQAAEGAPPAGDVESPAQQSPELDGDHNSNPSSGKPGPDESDADKEHKDRTAVQTAALAGVAFSVPFLIGLPKTVEPGLRLAYEAHVAFLCMIFFPAVYTFLHAFFKEEPAARRGEKKMIVLVFVSAMITFALRVYMDAFFAVSWVRVLPITAAALLLGGLYLRHEGDVWIPLIGQT